MKKTILAGLAVLSLGMGSAFAQGLPAGTKAPVYGSQAFPNQPYHNGTIFSEIFGHSRNGVDKAAAENAPRAKSS